MRNNILGLLHRMNMNTLPDDVQYLLPTLLGHYSELIVNGYPHSVFKSAFKVFLNHDRIFKSEHWKSLYHRTDRVLQYCHTAARVFSSRSNN
jgi:hypothetical protein